METHHSDPLKLEDLARTIHRSVSSLTALFRAALGTSPVDYLNTIRLEQAAKELRETNRPVSAVAFAHDFPTATTFRPVFPVVSAALRGSIAPGRKIRRRNPDNPFSVRFVRIALNCVSSPAGALHFPRGGTTFRKPETTEGIQSMLNKKLKRLAVYCSSRNGADPAFGRAAESWGRLMALREIELVYGGSSVGLMKKSRIRFSATAEKSPESIGRTLSRRASDQSDKNLHRPLHGGTEGMMLELSDAWLALPGGFGTLDEFFDALCLLQIGHHSKPCGLLNINGFYDPLLGFLENVRRSGMIRHRTVNSSMCIPPPPGSAGSSGGAVGVPRHPCSARRLLERAGTVRRLTKDQCVMPSASRIPFRYDAPRRRPQIAYPGEELSSPAIVGA